MPFCVLSGRITLLLLSALDSVNGQIRTASQAAVQLQTAKIADVGLSRAMKATVATLTNGHFMRGCGPPACASPVNHKIARSVHHAELVKLTTCAW